MDRKPRVLIVEDDAAVRVTLTDVIETLGYDIIAVADAKGAFSALELHAVDLIVLDIVMKGIDGLSAYRAIRRMGVNAPVVVYTAMPRSPAARELIRAGVSAVIAKPASVGELKRALSEAL
jgi:CheY-like chemotaxis protein